MESTDRQGCTACPHSSAQHAPPYCTTHRRLCREYISPACGEVEKAPGRILRLDKLLIDRMHSVNGGTLAPL